MSSHTIFWARGPGYGDALLSFPSMSPIHFLDATTKIQAVITAAHFYFLLESMKKDVLPTSPLCHLGGILPRGPGFVAFIVQTPSEDTSLPASSPSFCCVSGGFLLPSLVKKGVMETRLRTSQQFRQVAQKVLQSQPSCRCGFASKSLVLHWEILVQRSK